jgi:hypothetical protein
MKLIACINCGVVADFDRCCDIYGFNTEWSRGSDETKVTCCPNCKKEMPEDADYSNYLSPFTKKEEDK